MTTRPIAATGCITAAILLAIAGLPGQAKSDNTTQKPSPVQGTPAASWDSLADSFGGFKADTRPSRDTTMQFPSATEVREVTAVGGQRVKKGEVLIRARDADILAAIAVQKDLAENDNEIQSAQKQAELATFKRERLENAQTKFSPTEYEEARIGAEVAKVQLEQAKRNKQQNVLKLKQAEAQHERYYLEAPFDGIIEEVMVEVGEGVTEQTKVLRMVNIEKLWLDPYANTSDTIRQDLKQGSPAWVLVEMPDAPRLVKGKVLYVSPVADSVSQTRRVRVEIDNPQLWPAGTQARVRFTEPGSDWEKYKTTAPTTANTSPLSERALSASSDALPSSKGASSAPEGPKSLAVGVSPRNAATSAEPRRGDSGVHQNIASLHAHPSITAFVTSALDSAHAEIAAAEEARDSIFCPAQSGLPACQVNADCRLAFQSPPATPQTEHEVASGLTSNTFDFVTAHDVLWQPLPSWGCGTARYMAFGYFEQQWSRAWRLASAFSLGMRPSEFRFPDERWYCASDWPIRTVAVDTPALPDGDYSK